MKVKTIKSVIAKKLNEWLESITNPAVKELARSALTAHICSS